MASFFQDPFNIALYCLLALGVVSLWIRPLSAQLLVLAGVGLAFYLEYISGLGLIWLVIASILIVLYPSYEKPKGIKVFHAVGIFLISYLFYLHLMPGIYNPIVISDVQLSASSWAYRSYLNVDKIYLAVALLSCCIQLNRTRQDWVRTLQSILGPFLVVAVSLVILSLALGFVRFDLKWPSILWLWVPTNLLFVCVAEEALFRGFLQRKLTHCLEGIRQGHWIAIIVSAFAFGGLHHFGGPLYMLVSTIAGVGYGYAYFKSGERLESAIFVHFLINLSHIIFFSYPALL